MRLQTLGDRQMGLLTSLPGPRLKRTTVDRETSAVISYSSVAGNEIPLPDLLPLFLGLSCKRVKLPMEGWAAHHRSN